MIVTSSGVWVLDERQPVAAVLDPDTGAMRRLVSWAQLPPPPAGEDVVVCADEDGLWVQHSRLGPLVRVDLDGVATAVWTQGLVLAAAGFGGAWCTSPPPAQELVHGARAKPVTFTSGATVARVGPDGTVRKVFTDAPVSALATTEDAVWVQLDVEPAVLRNLGGETYEVNWSSRWVPLPWVGDLPQRIEAASGQPQLPSTAAAVDLGRMGYWSGYSYDPHADADSEEVVKAAGSLWRMGWEPDAQDESGGRRPGRFVAAAFAVPDPLVKPDPRVDEPSTEPVRVFQMGSYGITAAAGVGEHLVVVAGAPPPSLEPTPGGPKTGGSEAGASQASGLQAGGPEAERRAGRREQSSPCVVALQPGTGQLRLWLSGDEVDISDLCWPLLPQPLDADSYAQQVLASWSRMDHYWRGPDGWHPLTTGVSGSRARLVGDWPATRVEFTFDYAPRPGVRLRRYIALFDELGAIDNPEYADIGLMEDLDTERVPPLEDARDGFLDM
ncbi:hypothetical protein [Kineococcus sp. SYSU DK001]|uniref:hypothetical protein n=1 Tax=Kineococcus sp. SYSU DK001 TaxID=3383122 RepID=UPI003D7C832A